MTASADLAAALRAATSRLAAAGVSSPRADAEQLAAHLLGLRRGEVVAAALTGRALQPAQLLAFHDAVDQRAARVPLQHLTGRAAFRGLELDVGPGVFVPRPETEVIAEVAIRELTGRGERDDGADDVVVDLCTGSAAIALAVAAEVPATRVVALELDPHAHAWAQRNVEALAPGRVELLLADVVGADSGVLAHLAGRAAVVVANPPYIPQGARPLEPEVSEHDPPVALYGGGDDGLLLPAAVVATAAGLLAEGGLLVMEHGEAQADAVRALVAGPDWSDAATVQDLTGRDRGLVARRRRRPRSSRSVATPAIGDTAGAGSGRQVSDFPP